MQNILVINSSAADDDAASRLLVRNVVAELTAREPHATVVERDVGREPVPHLTADALGGLRGVPQTAGAQRTRELSDALLAELRAADVVVIGAPMYNFSVPTTLRAWFDYVLRAGETFAYSEATGPRGLLEGKRAIVVESRGGEYLQGPGRAIDFQEPYLKHLLGFMGIDDVTFIRAEKMGFGPDARAMALAGASAVIAAGLDYHRAAASAVAA